MSVFIKGVSKEDIMKYLSRGWILFDSRDIIEVDVPHGRIIDESKITQAYQENGWSIMPILTDAPTIIEAEGEVIDTKKHLCDSCKKTYPSCDCYYIEFGNGQGNDNIIRCDAFVEARASR